MYFVCATFVGSYMWDLDILEHTATDSGEEGNRILNIAYRHFYHCVIVTSKLVVFSLHDWWPVIVLQSSTG